MNISKKIKEALKNNNKFTTKPLKENKQKMKKLALKEIIKEEIFNILKEEGEKVTYDFPNSLSQILKDLESDEGLNPTTLTSALVLLKAKKELTKKHMTELAKTFIALLKPANSGKIQNFANSVKNIKPKKG